MILFQFISLNLLFWLTYVYGQLDVYNLPENVEPVRYTITIEVVNFTNFRGSVSTNLKIIKDTKSITLHAKNLLIDQESIEVIDSNSNLIEHTHSTGDEEKDFYTINFGDTLLQSKSYTLTIGNFIGSLDNQKHGFYKGYYIDNNLGKKYFAVTHLQPTYSRKVFPCFDEPRFKASFTINLIRSSMRVSASNMPLRETIDLGNNRFQDVYQESMLMSTYTVAFIICDYKYTQPNGIIRIFAQPEYVDDCSFNYSLTESGIILETVEHYMGIKYALPKLDFVVIHRDHFQPGAMENYGMITFRESYLIFCNNPISMYQIQKRYMRIVHEVVHQWFGNLVTPMSWHYLWLSKGFATYLEHAISQQIKPEWRLDEQFVINKLYRSYDAKNESVNFVFKNKDSKPNPYVSGARAASIIRMTFHFLTERVFHKALRLYIKKNQFKNTVPEDLYEAYEEALVDAPRESLLGHLTVHDILNTWNNIPNYPIVSVTRNYKTGSITFTQENVNKNINSIWYIPITYAFQNNIDDKFYKTVTNFWLTTKSATIYPNMTNGWLLVNKMVAGYYRVNYDETNWKRLNWFLQTEEYKKIPFVNWIQLFMDACYFAERKYVNNTIFFNLNQRFRKEIYSLHTTHNFYDCLEAVD